MSFKICVSGAAEGDCVNPETMAKAETVGEAIAKAGAILVTGATTGIPHAAAKGVKKVKGISIGFSPAASRADHINRYKLPTNYLDLTVYWFWVCRQKSYSDPQCRRCNNYLRPDWYAQ